MLCHTCSRLHWLITFFDLSFLHEFYPGTPKFYLGTGWVCPGVATPLVKMQWNRCTNPEQNDLLKAVTCLQCSEILVSWETAIDRIHYSVHVSNFVGSLMCREVRLNLLLRMYIHGTRVLSRVFR